MNEILKVFTLQQWVVIIAAGLNAVGLFWLLHQYFQSRFWVEAVTDATTGRVVGGDIQKSGAFALACILIIAITVAKLAYGRDAGAEVVSLVFALLGYSGVLQDIKRRGLQPPAPNFNVSESNVKIGPNGPATNTQKPAEPNPGPAATPFQFSTQPEPTE